MTDHRPAGQEPPVIAIFGVTGNLSKRKLLPALYHLFRQGLLPEGTRVVGISRRALTPEDLLSTVELCVLEKDNVCDPEGLRRVKAALQTFQLNPESPEDFKELGRLLDGFDAGARRNRLFYMSIPAAAYPPIIRNLAAAGLSEAHNRLLLEKPFGYDLESAEALIKLLSEDFDEDQIYRIDHYLAKETAQNLLAFRMHNPIFLPLWNGEHIRHVRIRASETIGIEGRTAFYEQTGALRDFVQSHLMQLLSITLMDVPADMSSHAIHEAKRHFLEGLEPADPARAERGQYDGYREETGQPGSHVETYAALRLSHSSQLWQGTDILLETGKALDVKSTDITVEFRTPHERRRNSLTFRIQPNEGISLDLVVKEPGFQDRMEHAALDFRYHDTFSDRQHIDAYERVLMDAIRGDRSLFASDHEVLATWRVLQPVLDAWTGSGEGLRSYEPGSAGPDTGSEPI
jgi:glucose-6-phosphate 1-dehydrogenase